MVRVQLFNYLCINTKTIGIISLNGGRFQTYAASIGTRKSIAYVDHYSYTAQAYNKLGQGIVSTYYPIDHLHTSPVSLKFETILDHD